MSGRKNFLSPHLLVSAGDMSGNITSNAIGIQGMDNLALQFIFTGSPTGTFDVQVSNNHVEQNGTVVTAGSWDSLPLSTTPAATGSAGSQSVNIQQLSFPWLRIVYTRTGSTGSLNAYISGKML